MEVIIYAHGKHIQFQRKCPLLGTIYQTWLKLKVNVCDAILVIKNKSQFLQENPCSLELNKKVKNRRASRIDKNL